MIRIDGENLPVDLLGGLQPAGLVVLDRGGESFRNGWHRRLFNSAAGRVGQECRVGRARASPSISGRISWWGLLRSVPPYGCLLDASRWPSAVLISSNTPAQSPGCLLAEEPHRGIPGAVAAIQQPAPVGNEGQRDPDGNSQRPGQVGDRRIAGDHQVQTSQHGRRVHEVVQAAAHLRDRKPAGHVLQLLHARPLLQADQAHAGQAGQRLEATQRDGAGTVVAERRTAPPEDADLETGDRGQLSSPVLDEPRVGEEVGNIGGYRFQGRVENARQASGAARRHRMAVDRCLARSPRRRPGSLPAAAAAVLAFHDHPGPTRLDQRRIADELDRVAKPLLGMEQDGSVLASGRPSQSGCRKGSGRNPLVCHRHSYSGQP